MPNLRGKASAKKIRKLMKQKRARHERHDITAEPVLGSSASVECSGGVLNEGLCDVATEQEVISGSVCDHNPVLCDVIDYVVPSAADDADPFVLSDPPECNDWSVWDHNPPELCDVTQFEVVATTPQVTTVRERQLNKKKERSRQSYYENHQKNLAKSRKYRATNKQKILDYAKEYSKQYRATNKQKVLNYSKKYSKKYRGSNKHKVSDYSKKYHASHREKRLEGFKDNYVANWEERLEGFKDSYIANREQRLEAFKDHYIANRQERLEGFKDNYASNLEQRKKIMHEYYASHSQQIKDNAREHYAAVANTKKAKLRQNYRIKRNLNPPTRSVSAKKRSKIIAKILQKRQKNLEYYLKNFLKLRQNRRARYNLAEPKIDTRNRYIAIIRQKLAKNKGVQKQLKVAFDIDKSLPIAVMQSDDDDLAKLIDCCFDDDDGEILSKDAEKDIQNDNVVTSDTKDKNNVDSGKRVKKRT
uniref:Uncharacterized protein n=1 Tax=Amphimedon queenslandica TaxID=400682 RepID=A0A1X7T965_AMPQE